MINMRYLRTYENFNKNSNQFVINLFERIKKVLYVLGLNIKISHTYNKAGTGKYKLAPVDLDIYTLKIDVNFANFGLLSLMTLPYHNFTNSILPHFNYKCPTDYTFNIKVSDPFTINNNDNNIWLNNNNVIMDIMNKILGDIFYEARNHKNDKEIRVTGVITDQPLNSSLTTIPILHEIIEYFSENSRMDEEDIINGVNKEIIIPDSILKIIEPNIKNYKNSIKLVATIKKKQPIIYKKLLTDLNIKSGVELNDMGFGDD